MLQSWLKNQGDFRDLLTIVILSAPDDFPNEDYFSEEQQLNLESCFELLLNSLDLISSDSNRVFAEDCLLKAKPLYEAGDQFTAVKLLASLRDRIAS